MNALQKRAAATRAIVATLLSTAVILSAAVPVNPSQLAASSRVSISSVQISSPGDRWA